MMNIPDKLRNYSCKLEIQKEKIEFRSRIKERLIKNYQKPWELSDEELRKNSNHKNDIKNRYYLDLIRIKREININANYDLMKFGTNSKQMEIHAKIWKEINDYLEGIENRTLTEKNYKNLINRVNRLTQNN